MMKAKFFTMVILGAVSAGCVVNLDGGGALSPTPTPIASPSGSQTPGTSPTPGSSPTPTPGSSPTPTPGASPSPTPVFTNAVYATEPYGVPANGAKVLVSDSAGEVVAQLLTGADGRAYADVPAGGSVAVLWTRVAGQPAEYFLTGYEAPPAGVELHFYVEPTANPSPTPTPASATLSVTFSNIPANTATIDWHANCHYYTSAPAATVTMTGVATCPRYPSGSQTGWNVVAIARDGSGAAIGWGLTADVPNSYGATAAIPVDLSHTDFDSTTIGFPTYPNMGSVSAYLSGWYNPDVYLSQGSPWPPPTPTPPSFTLAVPHGVLDSWYGSVRLEYQSGPTEWLDLAQGFTIPVADFGTEHDLDPAMIGTASGGTRDSTDLTRPVIQWNVSGSTGDQNRLILRWRTLDGQNVSHPITWDWHRPPDAPQSFRLPKLPSDWIFWAPAAGSSDFSEEVSYFDDDSMSGYLDSLTLNPATATGFRQSWYDFQ